MRLPWCLALALATACSSSTAGHSSDAVSSGGNLTVQAACRYPAGVETDIDAAGLGCFGSPPHQACQVSNGAVINVRDGAVTGGTESCSPLCGPSQFEMTCRGSVPSTVNVEPPASLGCQVIPIPTPSDLLFYCCPCLPN